MKKTKKVKKEKEERIVSFEPQQEDTQDCESCEVEREPIVKLPIDFPNEWLNNMARKINEIIDRLN